MKRTTALILAALATGCARPAYVTKSDAGKKYIHGGIARLSESYFDFTGPIPGYLYTVTVIEYNRAGNITLTDTFKGPDSVHVSREEYHYDPSGERMVRSVDRDQVKHTFTTSRYRHDAQGRLVSQTDEMSGWRVDYGYDRHGYLKTKVDTTNTGYPGETRYRYDRMGRLRVAASVRGGDPTKRYTYHGATDTVATIHSGKTDHDMYDRRGNLVRSTTDIIVERNKKGRIKRVVPATITAEYDYDERGNWIRRRQLYEGKQVGLAVRELQYYGEGGE
ncbi:MAG: hypothetical protein LBU98_00120 [Alistipes sp.]|jgi:YD repeat-containing protein|nr:hypothetical protein [Alistipes sp.]